jgi:hypothetical protein
MNTDVPDYNKSQTPENRKICDLLSREIDRCLTQAESKVWHSHPVWFLNGNPVVGYHKLKGGVGLLFWSGQTFGEAGLKNEGKFKAAGVLYTAAEPIDTTDLERWLKKSIEIQWDYQNMVKRKGVLERLT